jgi:octaprenyl-diphosphate synthase
MAEIYEAITPELRETCRIFDRELESQSPVVNRLCAHVKQFRGKMLRPALVLLSGKACGKLVPEHQTVAAVVEMVHMATLVHDDVLDDGDLRRGSSTINQLEGNEAAVLLGDYLLSHAYHLCNSLESHYAASTLTTTTNTICEGELEQVYERGNLDLTVDYYMNIIARKTASLTSTCCLLGGYLAGAGQEYIAACEGYGLDVGIAFQITDDILDITGSEKYTGKTLGRDMDKKKLTLPVIHGLNEASSEDKQELRSLLTSSSRNHERMRGILENAGSLDFAVNRAQHYVESAVRRIEILPESQARDILTMMARMITSRNS